MVIVQENDHQLLQQTTVYKQHVQEMVKEKIWGIYDKHI